MMKPEIEAALKALMDMSGKSIKMRVLKTNAPEERAQEVVEAEGQFEPSENFTPVAEEVLSDDDASMIEDALEKMKGC